MMQVADRPVVESPAMPKPYQPGLRARRLILAALLRAGGRMTAEALAADLDMPRPTVSMHVATMRRLGWVETRIGRTGGVILTESGRDAAEIASR